MALTCRWRSRPQHQLRTCCCVAANGRNGPIAEKARDARSVKPACELFQPLPHKCVDAHLSVGWEGGGLRCVNKLLTVTFHVANDRGSRPDLIPRNINEVLDAVTMKFISTAVGCHRLVEIGALLLC